MAFSDIGTDRQLDRPVRSVRRLQGVQWGPIAAAAGLFATGIVLRYLVRAHATNDAYVYMLWYRFARAHGIGGLREAFTNYTPFYSYLLLIATRFDAFGEPLSLVKLMSAAFELGCAALVAEMVWQGTRSPWRAAMAFASIWLAPTVLLNGAAWGQADAIWTFFTLAAVSLFMRDRNGVLPFAISVSVKAQGVFLGPFVLGMMLRRKLHWSWLAALPLTYLALALPVLAAGRAIGSVLGVYVGQAETFHFLTLNAANIWTVIGDIVPYRVGVPIGLVVATLAGAALSGAIGRSRREGPEYILLAACVSLILMPYLLPKMHERYFYAFELAIIALAWINPRYVPFAVIAQVDGVLSYMAFDPGIVWGVLPAALCNTFMAVYLVLGLSREDNDCPIPKLAWLAYVLSIVGLFLGSIIVGSNWDSSLAYWLATGLTAFAAAVLVMKGARRI